MAVILTRLTVDPLVDVSAANGFVELVHASLAATEAQLPVTHCVCALHAGLHADSGWLHQELQQSKWLDFLWSVIENHGPRAASLNVHGLALEDDRGAAAHVARP